MNPDNTEETIPHDLNKAPDAPNKELRETKRWEFNERVAQVLAPYSQRSLRSKLIGSGKGVSPSEKSPYSTATPAWANPCSLLILPPAYLPDDQCLTAHRVSRAVSFS